MEKRKKKYLRTGMSVLFFMFILCGFIVNAFAVDIGISTASSTAIPSEYHFAPRYLSGQTSVKLSDAPSGFKWVAKANTGYYQLQTTSGTAKMPSASYKGKVYATYYNVGTYMDSTIDMRITITDWSSNAHRIEFGRTYLGFGNASGDDGGYSKWISARIDYYYSNTTTLVEGFKGHQPIGDMDYWSNSGQCEYFEGKKNSLTKYIFGEADYNKFDFQLFESQGLVGVKEGYGGASNSDGLSFAYLVENASHEIYWYGGFLRMNLTCPIQEFEVWYMPNGGVGKPYSKVYKYGVTETWLENRFTRVGYHPRGGQDNAHWHVYRDFDDSWCVKNASGNSSWSTTVPSSCDDYFHYKSGGTVSATAKCGNVYAYLCWEANTYTIVYNGNGASGGNMENSLHTYDSSAYLNSNQFYKTGYSFLGWSTKKDGDVVYRDGQSVKNLTATQNGIVELFAVWAENEYENTIDHKVYGLNNDELVSLGMTTFYSNYNDEYMMDSSYCADIPPGFYLSQNFYVHSNDEWMKKQLGTIMKQEADDMSFLYQYYPLDYEITYDLNGGVNHPDNPTSYNVLEGVNLLEPTNDGREFLGWYLDDQLMTSINGERFEYDGDLDNFFNFLSTRLTGNITLKAKWDSSIPELTTKVAYYFKDEVVDSEKVKENAKAFDENDGDISHKIVISSFEYSDGSITKLPSYLDTSTCGVVRVLYTVVNSKGISTSKIGIVYIVEKGSADVSSSHIPTIYSRYISKKECVDGTIPLETLPEKSIWLYSDYYMLLIQSLNRFDYLHEYDYINQNSYVLNLKS